MGLNIQNFRAQATALGNSNLETSKQGGGIVKSGKAAWIKSVLNIGGAREANARTINALRVAVHRDPKFARVTEQADFLLGRLDAKRPLTGRKVIGFLDHMETVARASNAQAEQNKQHTISYAMSEMQTICQSAATLSGDPNLQLSDNDRDMISTVISACIAEKAGDYSVAPNKADIRGIVQDTVQKFVALQARLDRSALSPDMKARVTLQFADEEGFISPEMLERKINALENIEANDKVQALFTDVSTSDAPLPKALADAIRKEGIAVAVDENTLACLGTIIGKAIDKAGGMGQHVVSREEGQALVDKEVARFIDACREAGTFDSPEEQAFFRNLVSTSSFPISSVYIRELSERASSIPSGTFTALAAASTPAQLLEAIENMTHLLGEGFETLDNAHKQEGSEGRLEYITQCLQLALMREGMEPGGATALFDGMNSPLAKNVRDMMNFASGDSPSMATSRVVMLSTMEFIGRIGGVDVDAFMEEEAARPLPKDANEFSIHLRALLPEFTPVSGDVSLTRTQDVPAALASAERDFAAEMEGRIQGQMVTHMRKLGDGTVVPTFEKDLMRQGIRLVLDGAPLQRIDEIPEESLASPDGSPLSDTELAQRRREVVVSNGYNAFARLVTGRDDALFSELSPQDRAKALILTSIASQEIESAAYDKTLRALAPDFGTGTPESFMLSAAYGMSRRAVTFDITPAGDIVIQSHTRQTISALSKGTGAMEELDDARSSVEVGARLIIKRDEMERLSQLDWNLPAEALKSLPEAYQIHFADYGLLGEMCLFQK